ncbi:DUF4097 family beta strand repeat-containing protein [Leuconostoc rapi]|uniref:DUF4097 family beta strand repeat-containing protein n=1 Tax=Leuconostoc rapi TaxID=1406906 RepID=UPI00195A7391|nr:DUF4097 family beta strand repeat-containing protein [Leuconostoc rapi]MBM7436116.1 hypothetical protein [Leuconostoc rapi]
MTSIEMEIRTRLDIIFSKYTPNAQLTEFKEELIADLMEAYQDFAKQDKSHDEALDDAFDQLGDIDVVLRDLSQTNRTDEATHNDEPKKAPFIDISDDGFHIGNLHIDGQGVRLGDDIVIDGKHDKVQFGDWLHVDHDGARVGKKYYKFDDDTNINQSHFDDTVDDVKVPSWAAAHHNAQIPISDKQFVFDYHDAIVNFYTNDKTDLITVDEYFNRDNARYFAHIEENDDRVLISQGDHPLLFHVRTRINIGFPKNFDTGHITSINHSGRVIAQNLTLDTFNLIIHSGGFEGQQIKAKNASWEVHSGTIKADKLTFDKAEIFDKSGNVKLKNATIPHAKISATSGSVQVDHFIGGGQFSANSGFLRLRIDELTDDLKLHAHSSSLRVTAPETQHFNFDLSSNSGIVTVERHNNIHYDKNTPSYKRGFYGTNPKFTIDANANSGTIKVY